jgi:hypothetical protein
MKTLVLYDSLYGPTPSKSPRPSPASWASRKKLPSCVPLSLILPGLPV